MHLFIRFVPVSIGNLNHVSRTFCGICGQNHGLGDMNEYEALTPFDPDYVIPWDFAAEYRAEGGGPSLKLTKVKDQWLFTGRNANQVPIVCVSETEFKVPSQCPVFRLELDASEQVTPVTVLVNGREFQLPRVTQYNAT